MGIATYEYRMHRYQHLISGKTDQELLEVEFDLLMHVLPSGTIFRGAAKLAITDLSTPYRLSFEHPMFDDEHPNAIVKIETDYVRTCWVDTSEPEGSRLKQYNLFLGIRYLDKEGRNRFPL